MSTDSVADLITRVRNAQMVGHPSVDVRKSTLNKSILEVMKSEGFIESFEEDKSSDDVSKKWNFKVWLKYHEDGKPAISTSSRVSTPGRRIYKSCEDLVKVQGGLGVSILSTSQGVMSDREAKRKKIGGEVLFKIYA